MIYIENEGALFRGPARAWPREVWTGTKFEAYKGQVPKGIEWGNQIDEEEALRLVGGSSVDMASAAELVRAATVPGPESESGRCGHVDFRACIGSLVDESADRSRQRLHQGWWRAFVLGEPAGAHPVRPADKVCNTMSGGEISLKNFMDEGTARAVRETLDGRTSGSGGLVDERRLYNNLLSSQPLAFNFFGRLKRDPALASEIVQSLVPDIDGVTDVLFEFSPEDWVDNSAFDVALVVHARGQKGLLGLECKFTEPFSPKPYRNSRYEEIAEASGAFMASYETCTSSRFNQLFRNQLIAEDLVRRGDYDFRMTGLFCHQNDDRAIGTGTAFRDLLRDGDASFHIITFAQFIEAAQRLHLDWEQREWSMQLWARYCGLSLSDAAWRQYGEGR
jgi:hypothetical protein